MQENVKMQIKAKQNSISSVPLVVRSAEAGYSAERAAFYKL